MIALSDTLQCLRDAFSGMLKALPKKLGALRPPLKSLENVLISFQTVINEDTKSIRISAADFLGSLKPIPHDSYLAEGTDVLKLINKLIATHKKEMFYLPLETLEKTITVSSTETGSSSFSYMLDLTVQNGDRQAKSADGSDVSREQVALELYYDVFSDVTLFVPLIGSVLRILSLHIDSHIAMVPPKLLELCYSVLVILLLSGVLYRPQAQLCLQGLLTIEYRHIAKCDATKNAFYNLMTLESCFKYDQQFVFMRSVFFRILLCASATNIYLLEKHAGTTKQAFYTGIEDKLATIKYGLCRLFTILLALDRNFPSATRLHPTVSFRTLATETNIYDYASTMFLRIQATIESTELSLDNFTTMSARRYEQFQSLLNKADIMHLSNVINTSYAVKSLNNLPASGLRTYFYSVVSSSITQILSYSFYLRTSYLQASLPIPRIPRNIDMSIIPDAGEDKTINPYSSLDCENNRTDLHTDTLESYILSIIGEFCKILSRQPAALCTLLENMYLIVTVIIKDERHNRFRALTYRIVVQFIHIIIDALSIGLSVDSGDLYYISLCFLRRLHTVAFPLPGLFESIHSIFYYFLITPLHESESASIRAHGLIFIDLLLGTTYSRKDNTYTERQLNLFSILYNSYIAENEQTDRVHYGLSITYTKRPIMVNLLDAVAANLTNHMSLANVSLTIIDHKIFPLETLFCKYIDLSSYLDVEALGSSIGPLPHQTNDFPVKFATVADCAAHTLISVTRGLKSFLMDSKLNKTQQLMIFANKSLGNRITSLLNDYRRNTLMSEFATSSKPRQVINQMIVCGYLVDDSASVINFIIANNLSKKSFGLMLGDPAEANLLETFAEITFTKLQSFITSYRHVCQTTPSADMSINSRNSDYSMTQEMIPLIDTTNSLDSLFPLTVEKMQSMRSERARSSTPSLYKASLGSTEDTTQRTSHGRKPENIFLMSIRYYLSFFHIPGESQQIERILMAFSQHFVHLFSLLPEDVRKETTFTQELAYILSYAVLMLNTDLHNSSVKEKMTKDTFIKNTKCADKQNLIQVDFLAELYDGIIASPFSIDEIKIKQFISTHSFPQLCKRFGKCLSIELDCIFKECAGHPISNIVKISDNDDVLVDVLEEEMQLDLTSDLDTTMRASDSKADCASQQALLSLSATHTRSIEPVEKTTIDQQNPSADDDTSALTVEQMDIGNRTIPLQEIAYNLERNNPPSTPASSVSASQITRAAPLILRRNSSGGSFSISDIMAFKLYERFIRINITLNMCMDQFIKGTLAYITHHWNKPHAVFGMAIPELSFHLYRLCDYLIVCQTERNITEESICDVISREQTIARIFLFRSQLLRSLSLSSLFFIRRHVWQANIILPHMVAPELANAPQTNPRTGISKDDLTLSAQLASQYAIMALILFVFISSQVSSEAYEAIAHIRNISSLLFRLVADHNSKTLKHSFVLPHSEASRPFSVQDYASINVVDYFIHSYVRIFMHMNDIFQKLGVQTDLLGTSALALSHDILGLYKPLIDISAIFLLSYENISAIITETHQKDLHAYNAVRFPICIDYITFIVGIFKYRLRVLYRLNSPQHSQTNSPIHSPHQATAPDSSIYSPLTSAGVSKRDLLLSSSEKSYVDMVLEEFSYVYNSLIATLLYAYMYSQDSTENISTAAVIMRILAKLIKFLLPLFKDAFHFTDNRMCELFLLPLAHLSKLVVYPSMLSAIFIIIADIINAAKEIDNYDSIFSVLLSSLNRITNKSHTMCISNGLEELLCNKCFHEQEDVVVPYSRRKCLFNLSFICFYQGSGLASSSFLREPLINSTISADHGFSGSYSVIVPRKRSASSGLPVLSYVTRDSSIASSIGATVPYVNEYDWTVTYDNLDTLLAFLSSRVPSLTNQNASSFCSVIEKFTCLGETSISKTALGILRKLLETTLTLTSEHTISLLNCYPRILETATRTARSIALDNFMYSIATTLAHTRLSQDPIFLGSIFQTSIFPIIILQYNRNEYNILIFIAVILYKLFNVEEIQDLDDVKKYFDYTSIKLTHELLQPSLNSFISPLPQNFHDTTSPESQNIISKFFVLIIQLMRKHRPDHDALSILFDGVIKPVLRIAAKHQSLSTFRTKDYMYDPLIHLLSERVDAITEAAHSNELSIAPHVTEATILIRHVLCIVLSDELDIDAFAFVSSLISGPVLRLLQCLDKTPGSEYRLKSDDYTAICMGLSLTLLLAQLLTSSSTIRDYKLASLSRYLDREGYNMLDIISSVENCLRKCISILNILGNDVLRLKESIAEECRSIVYDLLSILRSFLSAQPPIKRLCKLTFRDIISLATHDSIDVRRALIVYLEAYDEYF